MKLVSLAATLLPAFAHASTQFSSLCTREGNVEIIIPYAVADSQLLKLTASDCTEADIGNGVTFDQGRDDATSELNDYITLTLNIATCKLDATTYDTPVFAKSFYTATALVRIGKKDGQTEFSFYEATISTECGFTTTYDVEHAYGTIAKNAHKDGEDGIVIQDGTIISAAWVDFGFTFTEYADNTYTTAYDTNNERVAGDRVFLKLKANSIEKMHYKYFPTTCVFSNGLTGTQEKTAVVYNGGADPATCSNSFLDFSITFGAYDDCFQIEHLLAQMGDSGHSTYKLNCRIEVCETHDTSSTCKGMAETCWGVQSTDAKAYQCHGCGYGACLASFNTNGDYTCYQ